MAERSSSGLTKNTVILAAASFLADLSTEMLTALQAAGDAVFVHHAVADYCVRLVMATRGRASSCRTSVCTAARHTAPGVSGEWAGI